MYIEENKWLLIINKTVKSCCQMNSLFSLPPELVQRTLRNIETNKLLQLCEEHPRLNDLACSAHVWKMKVLSVESSRQLQKLSSVPHLLHHIRHLDLSKAFLSDNDLKWVISLFPNLVSLNLNGLDSDRSDELIEAITISNGKTLQSLKLDRSYKVSNLAIEHISRHCEALRHLSLYACMFSNAAIMTLASSPLAGQLKSLNIGRCHLIEFDQVQMALRKFTRLASLNLSYNDSLMAVKVGELIKQLRNLHELDLTDCVEICRKDITVLGKLRPNLKVIHSSKIEDFSPASIRSYLISLQLNM